LEQNEIKSLYSHLSLELPDDLFQIVSKKVSQQLKKRMYGSAIQWIVVFQLMPFFSPKEILSLMIPQKKSWKDMSCYISHYKEAWKHNPTIMPMSYHDLCEWAAYEVATVGRSGQKAVNLMEQWGLPVDPFGQLQQLSIENFLNWAFSSGKSDDFAELCCNHWIELQVFFIQTSFQRSLWESVVRWTQFWNLRNDTTVGPMYVESQKILRLKKKNYANNEEYIIPTQQYQTYVCENLDSKQQLELNSNMNIKVSDYSSAQQRNMLKEKIHSKHRL